MHPSAGRASDSDLARWYLQRSQRAHRTLWALPLLAFLTMFVVVLMLRTGASDPDANLKQTRAEFMATKPAAIPPASNAVTVLSQAFAAHARFNAQVGAIASADPDTKLDAPSSYFEDNAVIAFYQSNANCIALLKSAAGMSACNWDLNYSAGPSMLMPHLAQIRASCRLLAGSARLKAHSGDHAGAASDIAAIYKLAEFTESDPVLISGLVSMACSGIADSAIETILAFDAPEKMEDLEHYRKALVTDRKTKERVLKFIRAERLFALLCVDLIGANAINPAVMGTGLPGVVPPAAVNLFYGPDRELTQKVFDEYVKQIEARGPSQKNSLEALVDKHQEGPAILTRSVIPALSRAELSFLRDQENAALLQLAIAVHAFRLKHKKDPQSLDEVVPEFLPKLPVSVFEGSQFSLRQDIGETNAIHTVRGAFSGKPVLRVYSWGEDGVDNSGLEAGRNSGPDRVIRLVPLSSAAAEDVEKAEPLQERDE
ncbi:MAG TPA: hypothetical protein VEK08_21765 [Planctomycetota bacterium]|nr:hypothetical protein [Planctomycetota bacterium]